MGIFLAGYYQVWPEKRPIKCQANDVKNYWGPHTHCELQNHVLAKSKFEIKLLNV